VISVDTKRKEIFGHYSNGGAEFAQKGEPVATNAYDFIGEAGKAVPCGVYDVGANTGWVNFGDFRPMNEGASGMRANHGGDQQGTKIMQTVQRMT
jgi:hypothetical protein